jgi:hypothetical protein
MFRGASMKNIQHVHNTTPNAQHGRPTIGLLLLGIEYANEERVWLGAMDASKAHEST